MSKCKYTSIGGQALIEGIMMKSPEKTSLAVRLPDGSIDISPMEYTSLRSRYKILNIPVIRGVVGFVESMVQGYKAMMISVDKSGFADLEDEKKSSVKAKSVAESEADENEISAEANTDEKSKKSTNVLLTVAMIIGTVLGVALAVILFMLLPRLFVDGIEKVFDTELPKLARSGIEQFLKLAIFVSYMWAVSFMKDIKRVFMYHGAEHKTIFCYEKGLELTVENVRKQSRFHPRCGTSFMILMILISVIFSTVIQMIFPQVYTIKWLWVIAKILMVPLICGVGFEVLKMCGKYDNVFTKIISAPGLWMQRISTKEPEDCMIEIAIAALRDCEPQNPDIDRAVDKCFVPTEEISEDAAEETEEIKENTDDNI